jgi:hypothetical protein
MAAPVGSLSSIPCRGCLGDGSIFVALHFFYDQGFFFFACPIFSAFIISGQTRHITQPVLSCHPDFPLPIFSLIRFKVQNRLLVL